MILRIGRGRVKPGSWDEFEKLYETLLVEGEQPDGIRARWLVRDSSDENSGFTIGIWESTETAADWVASDTFADVQEQMRPYFIGDYESYTCDVRLHEELGETS
jgi:heme-degrading monooxygenase HmoA